MPGPDVANRLSSLWRRASLKKGGLARALWPLSLLYGWLVRRRRQGFLRQVSRIQRLPVPVIVVGNIVVGGAGKTPTAMALIRHLQASGWHPGVVSRGFGRHGDSVVMLPDEPDARMHGDEPTLIRVRTGVPVCVGASRVDAARHLLLNCPEIDVVVCDDGLQHYALGRDIAVAVFDERGRGNGWLLPAGLLREPWPPLTLDRLSPDLVLQHNSADDSGCSVSMASALPVYRASRRLAATVRWADGRVSDLTELAGSRPVLVAGIARPEAFFTMVEQTGVLPGKCLALPDHVDTPTLKSSLEGLKGTVLCTEKDAVKLFALWQLMPGRERVRVGAVALELDIEPEFFQEIDRRLTQTGCRPRLSSDHGQKTA